MNKERDIARRWKYINRLFLSLAVALLVTVLLREYLLFRQNVSFFNNLIYDDYMAEVEQEVDNRVDQITALKNEMNTTFKNDLEYRLSLINYFLLEDVDALDTSATLQDKRDAFINAAYDYNTTHDDYLLFIIDPGGNHYLSGLRKEMEGTNVLGVQDPVTGAYIFQEMISSIEASQDNQVFISYYWIKEVGGEDIKKTSFILYNEDLDLILGMGMYQVDYEDALKLDIIDDFNQYYSEGDYAYIIGYDGTIYYHPDPAFTRSELLSIQTLDGRSFQESILSDLDTSNKACVQYIFNFGDLNQTKTGYVRSIDGWDMYIGRSFVIEDLEVETSNYIKSIIPGFIIYNLSLIAVFIGFTIIIKTLISSNFDDVSDLFKYKNHLIKEASFRDQLTNLYNRHMFEEIKEDIISKSTSLGVIMLDANGLKMINDTYGHSIGDTLLVSLAQTIEKVFHEDTVFRWGGDEFIVLIPNIDEARLLKKIDAYKLEEANLVIKDFIVSAALGYDIGNLNVVTIYDIIGRAEAMMYKEKTHESITIKRNMIDHLLNKLFEVDGIEEDHAKHVSELSLILGEALGLSKEQLNVLRLAALLHDIGKIGIDEAILTKSSPLSKEEYEQVKTHPERGYRILNSYSELIQYANIILSHQEWYNGQGYPAGIKGTDIPLMSRIITIADAFEAMTNKRTYKSILSYADAMLELDALKGLQFDPDLVELFVTTLTPKKYASLQKE